MIAHFLANIREKAGSHCSHHCPKDPGRNYQRFLHKRDLLDEKSSPLHQKSRTLRKSSEAQLCSEDQTEAYITSQ